MYCDARGSLVKETNNYGKNVSGALLDQTSAQQVQHLVSHMTFEMYSLPEHH